MKFDRLPTRRKPIRKTFYARLFNKPKKQRASAGTAQADDMDEPGINISRSLTIIFAIHILAIGMIFIHKQYLSGRTSLPEAAIVTAQPEKTTPAPSKARNNEMPTLSNGDKPYVVRKGDNYTVIAQKFQVDESELRQMNRSADIRSGLVLRIPQGRRIVAEVPPEVVAIRDQPVLNDSERGLVEILPQVDSSQAKLIRPTRSQLENAPRASVVSSGRTHVIKSGDNLWRISNTYKVSQKDLMSLNKISDPTKLKIGQIIKLP